MISKVVPSPTEAVADITDGVTIMIGGFGRGQGIPYNLIDALIERKVSNLTVITNNLYSLEDMVKEKMLAKVITTYEARGRYDPRHVVLEEAHKKGEVELEVVTQGNLPFRIQAAGAGMAGFYTRVGVGTILEKGKHKMSFDGEEYILERALHAEFALIKAYKSDTLGNLLYYRAARNINPTMAQAAQIVIAEVDEIVEAGELDPDIIVTSSIFVDRVVKAKTKPVDFELEWGTILEMQKGSTEGNKS